MANFSKVVDAETGEIYMVPSIDENYTDKIPGGIADIETNEPNMAENYERNTSIIELTEQVAALKAENALLKKEPSKKEELKTHLDSINLDEYNLASPLVPEENIGWSKDSKLIFKFGGVTIKRRKIKWQKSTR